MNGRFERMIGTDSLRKSKRFEAESGESTGSRRDGLLYLSNTSHSRITLSRQGEDQSASFGVCDAFQFLLAGYVRAIRQQLA